MGAYWGRVGEDVAWLAWNLGMKCLECEVIGLVLGGSRVRSAVAEAMNAPVHVPVRWFGKPKVYGKCDPFTFRQASSPQARQILAGKSDWHLVQEQIAPHLEVLFPNYATSSLTSHYNVTRYDPPGQPQGFDMHLVHVEVPAEQVGIADVELVVFQRYEEDNNETKGGL